jgi:hypothetical protein
MRSAEWLAQSSNRVIGLREVMSVPPFRIPQSAIRILF